MSLPYIILTVLSSREAAGYDITKEFSSSLGYFWKAGHQQIYRELNKMASNKFVTYRTEPQKGKPDRKVYSITDLGRNSLFEWIQEPARNLTLRDEISAKLLACRNHNSEPMQRNLEALIEELQNQLTHYRELEYTQFANYKELSRKARLERMVLRRNIYNFQAWIDWAEEVLTELKDIESDDVKLLGNSRILAQ